MGEKMNVYIESIFLLQFLCFAENMVLLVFYIIKIKLYLTSEKLCTTSEFPVQAHDTDCIQNIFVAYFH